MGGNCHAASHKRGRNTERRNRLEIRSSNSCCLQKDQDAASPARAACAILSLTYQKQPAAAQCPRWAVKSVAATTPAARSQAALRAAFTDERARKDRTAGAWGSSGAGFVGLVALRRRQQGRRWPATAGGTAEIARNWRAAEEIDVEMKKLVGTPDLRGGPCWASAIGLAWRGWQRHLQDRHKDDYRYSEQYAADDPPLSDDCINTAPPGSAE